MEMKNRLPNTIILSVCIILFITTVNSCKAQNVDSCKAHFKQSRLAQNAYYKTNNPDALKKALAEVEQAMDCPLTRKVAVTQKIGLLFLLKDYRTGYNYVNSLNETDFWHPYEKDMEYNYFRAKEYETKGDITNKNIYLNKAMHAIQAYIDKEDATSKKMDFMAYSLLFWMMKEMGDIGRIKAEIDTLKKKYPDNAGDIDTFKSMYIDGNNVHSAAPTYTTYK